MDTLNPAAIATFISHTHRGIRAPPWRIFREGDQRHLHGRARELPTQQRAPRELPKRIGMAQGGQRRPPWSDGFSEAFRQLKGYDVIPRLSDLTLDTPESDKTRRDYWDTITECFRKSYYAQIGDWCRAHGIRFFGHPLFEEPLSRMLHYQGDFFRTQREFHIQGVDNVFGRYGFAKLGGEYGSEPIACKLASSTANQKGRPFEEGEAKRVLCETHAVSPDDYSVEDMRRMADWLAVLGVNMLFLVGYPASRHGFKYFRLFDAGRHFGGMKPYCDYVARLSHILTRGVHKAPLAILFPTSSYWTRNNRNSLDDPSWKAVEGGFAELSISLLRRQLDFDYLFEDSLLEAAVERGRLSVGDERFPAIVVPPVTCLSEELREKLKRCVEAGCEVFIYNPRGAPLWTGDGDAGIVMPSLDQLLAALEPFGELRVKTRDNTPDDIIYHRREIGKESVFFIANTGERRHEEAIVSMKALGRPQLWDCGSGAAKPIEFLEKDGWREVRLSFEAYQSHLIVMTENGGGVT